MYREILSPYKYCQRRERQIVLRILSEHSVVVGLRISVEPCPVFLEKLYLFKNWRNVSTMFFFLFSQRHPETLILVQYPRIIQSTGFWSLPWHKVFLLNFIFFGVLPSTPERRFVSEHLKLTSIIFVRNMISVLYERAAQSDKGMWKQIESVWTTCPSHCQIQKIRNKLYS